MRPLCSSGVGTSRRTTGIGGMASTRAVSDRSPRPSNDTSRMSAAAASKAGRNLGNAYPPRRSAAKETPPDAAASMSAARESAERTTSMPRASQSETAWSLTVTGSTTRPSSSPRPAVSSKKARIDSSSSSTRPESSMRVSRSPPASITAPRSAPEPRTGLGDASPADRGVDRDHAPRLGVGVQAQHVRPDLRQQVRHDGARRAEGQVEHELDLSPGIVPKVERLDHIGRVVLQRPGREGDVTDVGCGHPAELFAVVETLDTALFALGQVDTAVVEEPYDHRLRVVRAQPDREPGLVAATAHMVARDGDRGQLQVGHVHAGGIAPDHEGALEHPRGPARVT